MSSLVTIKAPTKEGEQIDVQGNVVYLNVGSTKVKFLIQYNPDALLSEKFLTHYASGNKVGSLSTLENAIAYATNVVRPTDRENAEKLIEALCKKHGPEKVLRVMNNATVIN